MKWLLLLTCLGLWTTSVYGEDSPPSVCQQTQATINSHAGAINEWANSVSKIPPTTDSTRTALFQQEAENYIQRVSETLNSCNTEMLGQKNLAKGMLCTAEREIGAGDKGMFAKAKIMKGAFGDIEKVLIGVVAKEPCSLVMSEHDVRKNKKKSTPKVCKGDYQPGLVSAYLDDASARTWIEKAEKGCEEIAGKMGDEMNQQLVLASNYKSSASKTANLVKWGGAAAAVIGAVELYDRYDDKKDRKKERRRQQALVEEFQNGIIRGDDNKPVDCKKTETYKLPECQKALMSYCSRMENNQKGGCQSFYSHYCATDGADSNFCFVQAARNHCNVPGANVPIGGIKLSDSPACQWTAQLPDECRTGADSLVCYPKFDEALLNEQCPTFPNDPVCQRHNSGTLVLQPNDLPGLRIPTPVESDSSASLASLIGDAAARAPTNTDQTTALPADSSLTDWTTSAYGGLCRSGQVCGK